MGELSALLPWNVSKNPYEIQDAYGRRIVDCCAAGMPVEFDMGNAALIVRCVNSHDALVKALEECANDLEAEIEHRYANTKPHLERQYERDIAPVRQARAALAAASTTRVWQVDTVEGMVKVIPPKRKR